MIFQPIHPEDIRKYLLLKNLNHTDLASTEREKKLNILYKGKQLTKKYFADFICYNEIIEELKATKAITAKHKAQVINYLKATNKEVGLLINFGLSTLKWERISIFGLTR